MWQNGANGSGFDDYNSNDGIWFNGDTQNTLLVQSPSAGGFHALSEVGGRGGNIQAFRTRTVKDSDQSIVGGSAFTMQWHSNTGWAFQLDSTLNEGFGLSNTAFSFSSGGFASGNPGLFLAPNGVTFYTNNVTTITAKTAVPSSGTWAKDDLVLNQNGGAGSLFAWRCTSAGSPGTWEELYVSPEHVLSTTLVDLSVSTKQTLFTVPTAKNLIVTKVVSRGPTATITTAAGGVGYDAGGTNVETVSMPSTATTYAITFANTSSSTTPGTIGVAASVLGFKTTATQASTSMTIDVFGYFF
jgi:hypothetical protein